MLQCQQIFSLFIRHKCINYINIIKGKENARNSVTTPFMEVLNNTKSVVNRCAQSNECMQNVMKEKEDLWLVCRKALEVFNSFIYNITLIIYPSIYHLYL